MNLKPEGDKTEPFLKRQNWFFAAGLTFIIYLLLLLFLWGYGDEETAWMLKAVHVMLALAAIMVGLGVLDRRRREEADRERKVKRYQTRMFLDKLEKEKKITAQKKGSQS